MAGQRKDATLTERIHAKCVWLDNGCIEWTGWTLSGYGRIRWQGKRIAVHRAIYEMNFGPLGDLCVCHRCDNPICVNPDHLFAGTRADNNADKTRKGRQARGPGHGVPGERSHFAKLTPDQVLKIRSMRGLNQYEIAARFKVSQSQVSNILNRKTWSHL